MLPTLPKQAEPRTCPCFGARKNFIYSVLVTQCSIDLISYLVLTTPCSRNWAYRGQVTCSRPATYEKLGVDLGPAHLTPEPGGVLADMAA